MSERAVASALWPTSAGEWVSRRKWTPSTIVSIDVTDTPSARTTAASSPGPATTRRPRSASERSIAAISSSSRIGSVPRLAAVLAVPVAVRRRRGSDAASARRLGGRRDVRRGLRRRRVVLRAVVVAGAATAVRAAAARAVVAAAAAALAGGVGAVEGRERDLVGDRRGGAAVGVGDGHVVVPDLSRDRPALHLDAVDVGHRLESVRV